MLIYIFAQKQKSAFVSEASKKQNVSDEPSVENTTTKPTEHSQNVHAKVAALTRINQANRENTPALEELKRQMRDRGEGVQTITSEGEVAILYPPKPSVTAVRVKKDGTLEIGCFHDGDKLQEHIDGKGEDGQKVEMVDR